MLLAFDVDGTLIGEHSESGAPSQRTVAAIEACAQQLGAVVTLATGRDASDASDFASSFIPSCRFVVSSNGKEPLLILFPDMMQAVNFTKAMTILKMYADSGGHES